MILTLRDDAIVIWNDFWNDCHDWG